MGVHKRSGRALVDTQAEQLRARHLLVVLDNCEHAVKACAELVGTLSSACPKLHVLATSGSTSNEIVRSAAHGNAMVLTDASTEFNIHRWSADSSAPIS